MLALIDIPTIFAIVACFILYGAFVAIVIGLIVKWRSSEARLERLENERRKKECELTTYTANLKRAREGSPLAGIYKINMALLELDIQELDTRIGALKYEIEMKKLEER